MAKLAVAVICGVALISQLGRVSPVADFVNNFAPIWLCLGLVALIVGLSLDPRSAFLRIALVLMLVCTGDILGPELFRKTPPYALAGRQRTLRIIQFNLFKQNQALDRAAMWIAAQHADIVILEEVLRNSVVLDRLRREFPYGVSCLSAMRCSTVILSRQKPVDSGGLARGDPENRKAASVAWASFAGPAGPFTVIGAHYQHPWPFGDQDSARSAISATLNDVARDRAIVAGDFNLGPWTFAMSRQDREFAIPRLTGALATWPAPTPILPIDHVYAGSAWHLMAIERGPSLGSDHYPLMLVLSAAEGRPPKWRFHP